MAVSGMYGPFRPRVGERMEVMISHAEYDKDSLFYVLWGQFHLSTVEQIEEALAGLQDTIQDKPHPAGQLRQGDLCVGKSIQDNQWHRAVIQTATGNDVLASYVDYGSTEFVPRSRIRIQDPELTLNFGAQATRLILRGIEPIFSRGGIKPGTLDYLDRHVVNKVFVCEPMEHYGDAVLVKLYAVNGKRDISAQFIADGFAEPASHTLPASPPSPLGGVEEVKFNPLPVMGLDEGQRERVYVSHIDSPNQFWLQQEVVAVDLDDMMSDMQAFFRDPRSAKPIMQAVATLPCVTMYAEDKQYYRCQVTRSTSPRTCEVFFVDYGNRDQVDISALYHLPEQFSKLPGAAIEAGLSGIDPRSCSSEKSSTRFEELVMEKIICVKADSIEGNRVLVSMVDPRSEMSLSIGEILIKEKLATRTVVRPPHKPPSDGIGPPPSRGSSRSSGSSQVSPRGHHSQVSPRGQPQAVAGLTHPTLREGSRHPVTITDITSSCDFACQLLSNSDRFEEMSEILQRDYAARGARDGRLNDIHVGSVCCAQFSQDGMWYRAEVTGVSDRSAEVYFVDYGNEDSLPFEKLKRLDPKYSRIEAQSVRCRLDKVQDLVQHSNKMKAKFEELVGEDEHEARICQSQEDALVIELVNKASGVNVNEEMRRFCTPLQQTQRPQAPRRSVSDEFVKLELRRGDKMKVYVSNVESPNLFHCQPVSSAQELQELMDSLNEERTLKAATPPFQPKLQAPCMARYSLDGNWYRALITGTKRSGEFEVRFVDFGNHETVSPSAIRPLQSSFMSFPMQGIPCSLEGLPFKAWTEEEITRFSEMWGDDAEQELEFGNRVGENYEVRLRTETGICINDVLKPVRSPTGGGVSPGRGGGGLTQPAQTSPSRGGEIHQFIERDLEVGPDVPVYISHVENLSELWCQPASTTKDLETLMMKLDQKYSKLKPDQMAVKKPRLGMACVAQFQEDKNWYRAIVINKQLRRVYVCFVDYGNFEYVPVSCIKEIDREIMKVPAVAVKCSLRGSKDLEGPLRVKKLQGLIDEVDCFSCKVVSSANGVFEVDITYSGGKSVVDVLRSIPKEKEPAPAKSQTPPRGQKSAPPKSPMSTAIPRGQSPPRAQRTFDSRPQTQEVTQQATQRQDRGDRWGGGPPSTNQKQPKEEGWGEVTTSPPPTKPVAPTPTAIQPSPGSHPVTPAVFRHIKRQEESMTIGEFVDVVVSFLESPARFWLQQASTCPEIDALGETLSAHASSGKLQPTKSVENGQLCVARSVTDEAYYRARVLKRVGEDQVEVYYIDYGNREVVPPSSVLTITQDLLRLPAQAMQSSLKDTSRTSIFAEEVVEQFTEQTMDKQLIANPTKKLVNSLVVELVDTNTEEDLDISAEVKKLVGDSAVSTLPQPEIPDEGAVYVTQVAEDGSFFVQLASSSDALEMVHADIQTAYAEEVASLGEAKPGQLCCGLYSEDKEWYRGVVETVQESGDATVRFLDYGNASSIKVSELKVLLPQFLDKPAIAIKCELHDVHLTGIVEIGAALEVTTLDKELCCKFHDKEVPCQVSLSENDVSVNDGIKKKFGHASAEQVGVISEPGTDWTFQTVEPEKKFEAYVSSVVSPGYFFVQPSSVTKELEDLMVEMQSAYSQQSAELLLCAGDVPTGTLCAALYAEDNQWYRAEILQQDGDRVTVLFPDYGNSDIVSRASLKVLQKKHSDVSLKAIGCSVSGVAPPTGSWSAQSGEYFEAETMDKPLLVEVIDIAAANPSAGKVIHSVKLLDMGMNVADKLIKAGHATDGSTLPAQETTVGQVQAELVISNIQTFSGYSSYQLDPGSTEAIFITAVTTLSDFCIQLARHLDEVAEFGGRVDEFYKANKVAAITEAKVGASCVAQFSEDEVWYRAVIGEVTDGNAYVTFVDYGNGDLVPVSSVKELKEEFAKQPAFAFKCSLGGVDPEKSAEDGKVGKFEELMDKETLTAKVLARREGVFHVQVSDGGVSIAGALGLEEDLSNYELLTVRESTQAAGTTGQTPAQLVVSGVRTFPGYPSYHLDPSTTEGIFITAVTSLADFCIQLSRHADEVAEFGGKVDEFYKANEVAAATDAKVGTPCVAQFSEDEVWYRAVIGEITDENAYVTFVDYGNGDSVPVSSVKELKEEFATQPAYAFRCSLGGINPEETTEEGKVGKFEELMDKETLTAKVLGRRDGVFDVQVLDGGASVAASLGLAEDLSKYETTTDGISEAAPEMERVTSSTMFPGYTTGMLPVGAMKAVFLTSVTSFSEFCVQLGSDADAVAGFTAELDEFYKGNEVPCPESVEVGTVCAAQFTDDEVWYRASVISLEGDEADVLFVDYGNSDTLPKTALKVLDVKFSEMPTFALKCRLAGVDESADENEAALDKFQEFLECESLQVRVIDCDDAVLSVQLLNNGKSITPDLGLTETVEAPSIVKPYNSYEVSPGTTESVYLTSVSSLNDFAIQLEKFEDEVAEFNAKLDAFYKTNTTDELGLAVPGVQCVGKFSDDGVWYRGRVEHLEGTAAEVTFVDYGNNDLIEISELKELHPDFVEQHTFSFQCQLAGIPDKQGEDVVAKFEEYMESESLVATAIALEAGGRLVVRLLDGEESVAVKLGLTEDLTSETANGSLNTTAHSLAEDALSSAMKDIDLEDSPPTAEADEAVAESGDAGEQMPETEAEPTEDETQKMAPTDGASKPAAVEGDPESIASTLIKEVVESACREVGQLTLEDDDGGAAESTPDMVTPEMSPPRVAVSPPDGSTQDEDEFQDATTSPKRETTEGGADSALDVEKGESPPSGGEDEEESFEDALDESQTAGEAPEETETGEDVQGAKAEEDSEGMGEVAMATGSGSEDQAGGTDGDNDDETKDLEAVELDETNSVPDTDATQQEREPAESEGVAENGGKEEDVAMATSSDHVETGDSAVSGEENGELVMADGEPDSDTIEGAGSTQARAENRGDSPEVTMETVSGEAIESDIAVDGQDEESSNEGTMNTLDQVETVNDEGPSVVEKEHCVQNGLDAEDEGVVNDGSEKGSLGQSGEEGGPPEGSGDKVVTAGGDVDIPVKSGSVLPEEGGEGGKATEDVQGVDSPQPVEVTTEEQVDG